MGDWNFLGGILEEVHIHSTMVGKIWLTILFIFRMLVLGVAAEDVWNDEQSDFICNTDQPGCRNVCYDQAFPISLIRYWVLQVIFVSSPSLVYMGHAIYQLRALEKERHCKKVALRRELEAVDVELVEIRRRIEKEMKQLEQGKLNKAPLRGSLLCTYLVHIVTRSVVEVSFMVCQYVLYGIANPLYKCEREPCPNVVDCFVSRPTEKTVFMVFMQSIACISLFLSLLEIMHLGYKKLKKVILSYYPHLKADLDDYYVDKSKKNSVVHQVNVGSSVARKNTIPEAPCGYTLLLEKQGNGPTYPLLNASSAFIPIKGDPGAKPDGHKDAKEGVPSPTERTGDTSSETRSPPADKQEPEEQSPHHKDMVCAGSEYPTLPVADTSSCTTLSGIVRKSRRVSPPWNCSTLVEGNGSDSGDSYHGNNSVKLRSSCVGPRARVLSKSDIKRPSRSQSPDSAGELSSVSRHSRESNSPTASSPNRRVSAASSTSSRRAPTDLQI
ncbi:LOW QUALITY PROTEIN: gap junction alpha-9 protein-like [Plectropomus leopardus]|uniref:LOW QUALITY PROTEIN: gap junction alpha-9 protein-like n=1 Tax=Plectropomus leopardus TaxID=160734 RepID=UPI001C4CB20A|nr:LOW QUALITY PROTEIN: gap junction alpha-9 protein-like [Plectropomus leopardus]